MKDNQNITVELLAHLLPWLNRAAGSLASSRRGTTTAEDLAQDAILEFLVRARRGWFDGPTRVNREARARHLLRLCLGHAVTRADRRAAKSRRLATAQGQRYVVAQFHPTPTDLDQRIDSARRYRKVQHMLSRLNPVRQLVLLAVVAPDSVSTAHLRAAKACREGGGAWVVRPIDETLHLLQVAAADPGLRGDLPAWKATVAEILRLRTPLGDADAAALRRARDALKKTLQRARGALQIFIHPHTQHPHRSTRVAFGRPRRIAGSRNTGEMHHATEPPGLTVLHKRHTSRRRMR